VGPDAEVDLHVAETSPDFLLHATIHSCEFSSTYRFPIESRSRISFTYLERGKVFCIVVSMFIFNHCFK
jgi:hypothetical protein